MFYQPGVTDHGLPFDPFKACVVPRPIGWISTVSPPLPSSAQATHSSPASRAAEHVNGDEQGSTSRSPHHTDTPTTRPTRSHNLAPYSQFQNLTYSPPYVMFSANQSPDNTSKDTARNAELTGVFCWQLATYALREAVNITSEEFEYGVDEFEKAGLTKTWSRALKTPVPMVEESPVRFECEYYSTIRLPGEPPMGSVDVIIGKVVAVHIDDDVLTDGKLDVAKTVPIARCGYYQYAVIRETFDMFKPGSQAMRDGMEGSAKKIRQSLETQTKK